MDTSALSMDELFQEIQKLPDWQRYAWPEVFYEHFKVEKPKARDSSVLECIMYQPPPHQSLNQDGKTEIRPPAEGGVRIIENYMSLPVETTLIQDEEDKKIEAKRKEQEEIDARNKEKFAEIYKKLNFQPMVYSGKTITLSSAKNLKDQNVDDTKQD